MNKVVVIAINSIFGKPSNIGFRPFQVIDNISQNDISSIYIVARGVFKKLFKSKVTHLFSMGIFGHIPRLMNAYRIYIDQSFDLRKWDIALFEYFSIRTLKKILQTHPDDIVLLHCYEYAPKLVKYAKQQGVTVIQDIAIAPGKTSLKLHENNLMHFKDVSVIRRQIDVEYKLFSYADHIIAPSVFVMNELLEYDVSSDKISVIPFGVLYDEMYAIPSSVLQNESVDFCFAGLINSRKGIDWLVKAFSDPVFKNDKLHLCGRVFKEQKNLLAQCNLTNILTPGFVDTSIYMRTCDVYVFPSLMEGSSKSIYEAMASGLPVIATENSGSIIRDGVDGFVIEAGNAEILKEKMLFFKENPDKIVEMGLSAQKYVRGFSWGKYSNNVINTYKRDMKNS